MSRAPTASGEREGNKVTRVKASVQTCSPESLDLRHAQKSFTRNSGGPVRGRVASGRVREVERYNADDNEQEVGQRHSSEEVNEQRVLR